MCGPWDREMGLVDGTNVALVSLLWVVQYQGVVFNL